MSDFVDSFVNNKDLHGHALAHSIPTFAELSSPLEETNKVISSGNRRQT